MTSSKQYLTKYLKTFMSESILVRFELNLIIFYVKVRDIEINYRINEAMLGTCENLESYARFIEHELLLRIKAMDKQ